MKSRPLARLVVIGTASLLAFAACGDDDDSTGSNEGGTSSNAGAAGQPPAAKGPLECQVLGELCHEADTGSGPAHDYALLSEPGEVERV